MRRPALHTPLLMLSQILVEAVSKPLYIAISISIECLERGGYGGVHFKEEGGYKDGANVDVVAPEDGVVEGLVELRKVSQMSSKPRGPSGHHTAIWKRGDKDLVMSGRVGGVLILDMVGYGTQT